MKWLRAVRQFFNHRQVRHFAFDGKSTGFSLEEPPFGATVRKSRKGLRLRVRRPRFWPGLLMGFCATCFGALSVQSWISFGGDWGMALFAFLPFFMIFLLSTLYNWLGQEEIRITRSHLVHRRVLFGIGIPHRVPLHTLERIGFRTRQYKTNGPGGTYGSPWSNINTDRDLSSMRVLKIIGTHNEISIRDLSLVHYDYTRFFLETTLAGLPGRLRAAKKKTARKRRT